MKQDPEKHNLSLPIHLGEFRLWSMRLRVVTMPFSFASPALDPGAWPALPEDPAVDGLALPSARLRGPLRVVQSEGDRLIYVRKTYKRHFIELTGTMEDYETGFSGKTRSTLRRKSRKFAELDNGTLDVRRYTSPAEMDIFFDLAREVSTHTYQERLLDAGLPETPDFLNEMKALAAADQVRAYILFLGGQPVSYLYLPADGDRLIYAYLGYLPEHARLSPGTVLQRAALEDIFAEGKYQVFDFTEGQGAHKELFGTGHIDCADVLILRKTLRNRIKVAIHRTSTMISDGLSAFLNRIGLKTTLKRWIRRSA